MKKVALIMAGGKGERFWPRSLNSKPKQFLCLTDDGVTMIQHAVNRIKDVISWEDIFVVTNKSHYLLVKSQLPLLPKENIICEPVGRNTAPCIGLGTAHILNKYGDAVMIVLPSDHLIQYTALFHDALETACKIAEKDNNLVTMGIPPTYPETGYGYIQFDKDNKCDGAYKVLEFVEKPDLDKAKSYLAQGTYLWNSGMFVWKASSIMKNIEMHMKVVYDGLLQIQEALKSNVSNEIDGIFEKFPSESIDYGVLEKANHLYIVPGTFGWDDVGSWSAMERLNPIDEFGNVIHGDCVLVNVKNCTIQGGKKLIAAIGMENTIIVEGKDAILICAKSSVQDIKQITQKLRLCGREDLL